ncbi:DVU_1555 family C-GCAxxG-C-C protein [Desulfitobacterium hafniense]|uniref:C_GCAxxG_C_C family protein n=1 Tax=Desulfitobacterium hafniense (strain Y51) TaxID=138119 RepID=Q24Z75_DESHY|nr:DV_1555 family C-GCAxxG-C-C protein [Desulfitobacterium hafniense]BAE82667.1 hypothetical protein DSY0878 [Desulfitobacterium hafniense Y51]
MDTLRLFELKQQGYCCSQILLKMGLEDARREENADLIQAVRGLCDGLQTGMICGILTGSTCLLALLQPEDAKLLISDLVEWFKCEYGENNGGITCYDILAGNPLNRFSKCPQILAAAYDKVMEMLEANGYEF